MEYTILIILLLPLLSGLISLVRHHNAIPSAIIGLSTVLSIILAIRLWNDPLILESNWFTIGGQGITFSIYITNWASGLLVIVNLISLLVHAFSGKYMRDDAGIKRYFAVLGLFTFGMTGTVISGNLLVMFMFWELVGVSSYLLIGHWWNKETATRAAKKAFIFNRIGDIGFMIAIALCWSQFGTFDIFQYSELIREVDSTILFWMGMSFFMGAMGKSAQFPLMLWLPDAMEGPTPVSALIHAATMVAAGVYLLIRLNVLYIGVSTDVILFIGALTALIGAFSALFQSDIKKVLAYSTISQLGYMMAGFGAGSTFSAGFHLFTHAFFKAGLFLAAAAIIDYLHQAYHHKDLDVQDMRNMGGLRKVLPITFITFTVFTLALIGVPLFSGFLSKDAILLALWDNAEAGNAVAYVAAASCFISVALTAFYMTRQWFLIFMGELNETTSNINETSMTYKLILIILAVMSIGFVWSVNPINVNSVWLAKDLTHSDKGLQVMLTSVILILVGCGSGYLLYKPGGSLRTQFLKGNEKGFLPNLSTNGLYLDKIYYTVIQKPILLFSVRTGSFDRKVLDGVINSIGVSTVVLAHAVKIFDRYFVDGLVNLSAFMAGMVGTVTKNFQGGKIQTYILMSVIGLLIIIFLALS